MKVPTKKEGQLEFGLSRGETITIEVTPIGTGQKVLYDLYGKTQLLEPDENITFRLKPAAKANYSNRTPLRLQLHFTEESGGAYTVRVLGSGGGIYTQTLRQSSAQRMEQLTCSFSELGGDETKPGY